MNFKIYPKRVLNILLIIIFILLLANIITVIYQNNGNNKWYINLFDFGGESNAPAFYSTVVLFFCFLLLGFITFIHKKAGLNYLLWLLLTLSFLFISFDESVQIHEKIAAFLMSKFNFSEFFYFAWVIPYGIASLLFGFLFYFKLLLKLPKKIMRLFIISGTLFILGAIGFEMLGAAEVTSANKSETKIALLYTIEELLEMLGIALFAYTLLLYIKEDLKISIDTNENSLKS